MAFIPLVSLILKYFILTAKLQTSDTLNNHDFDDQTLSFYADGCAITLNADATSYTVKSTINEASIVNLAITRTALDFVVRMIDNTYFGTEPNSP